MDLNILDYFLRVAEVGSINRAAQDLQVSQPSLSRKIAQLEHDIGTPLFVRDTTGTRLTEAGVLLANRARPILHEASLLKEEVGREGAALISLALPSSWNRTITVPFVERILARYPDYNLHVYEGVTSALDGWMQRRMVDIGIAVSYVRIPNFRKTPVVEEDLLLVGPASSGLSLDAPFTPRQLSEQRLILPGNVNPVRRHLESLMARKGLRLRPVLEAESISLCIEMALRGIGYTILPYSAVHWYQQEDALAAARIRGFTLPWSLAVNQERTHSVSVRRVAEELRQFVLERAAQAEWRFVRSTSGKADAADDLGSGEIAPAVLTG